MAARKKNKDPFQSLRPQETEVPVGDHILILKTATLDQEGRLLSVLSTLDLGELVMPLGEIMSNLEGNEGGGVAPMISPMRL